MVFFPINNLALDLVFLLKLPFYLSLSSGSVFLMLRNPSVESLLISKKHLILFPRSPLLQTLSSLQLPPHLLCWFHAYLSSRTQQAKVLNSLLKRHMLDLVFPKAPFLALSFLSSTLMISPHFPSPPPPPSHCMLTTSCYPAPSHRLPASTQFSLTLTSSLPGFCLNISPSTSRKPNT